MFLFKGDFFQGYSDAVLMDIYSDSVRVFLVRKDETGAPAVRGAAVEEQEGDVFLEDGSLNVEKIMLNSGKALQSLRRGHDIPKDARLIVGLSGDISACSYKEVSVQRDNKEKKISPAEIDALLTKSHHLEEKVKDAHAQNIAQSFLVDGFLVEHPVGMQGAEITARMVHIAVEKHFGEAMTHFASGYGMRFAGFADMPFACAQEFPRFASSDDGIAILVFARTAHMVLVRKRRVAGMVTVQKGYDDITRAVAQAWGVGMSEARKIMRQFRHEEANTKTVQNITAVLLPAVVQVMTGITDGILRLDKDNLLPGSIFAGAAYDIFELSRALVDTAWIAPLPCERGASVRLISEVLSGAPYEAMVQGGGPEFVFDRLTLDYLSLK